MVSLRSIVAAVLVPVIVTCILQGVNGEQQHKTNVGVDTKERQRPVYVVPSPLRWRQLGGVQPGRARLTLLTYARSDNQTCPSCKVLESAVWGLQDALDGASTHSSRQEQSRSKRGGSAHQRLEGSTDQQPPDEIPALLSPVRSGYAPLDIVVVYCNLFPPGAAPCGGQQALPSLRLQSRLATVEDDDDEDEEDANTRKPTEQEQQGYLDEQLPAGAPLSVSSLLGWISATEERLGLGVDPIDADGSGGVTVSSNVAAAMRNAMMALEATPYTEASRKEEATLVSTTAGVRALSSKEFRGLLNELAATSNENDNEKEEDRFLVTLFTTTECRRCGPPLYELERLSAALRRAGRSSPRIEFLRVPIDSVLRALLLVDASTDVPIVTVAHYPLSSLHGGNTVCRSSTGNCRGALFYTEPFTAEALLRYMQIEYNIFRDVSLVEPTSLFSSSSQQQEDPFSQQIEGIRRSSISGDEEASGYTNNIAAVWNNHTAIADVDAWFEGCSSMSASGGVLPFLRGDATPQQRHCFLYMGASYLLPLRPALQRDLSVFVGTANIYRDLGDAVRFTVVDVASLTDAVLAHLLRRLGAASDTAAVSTIYCPSWSCVWYVTKGNASSSREIHMSLLPGSFTDSRVIEEVLVAALGEQKAELASRVKSSAPSMKVKREQQIAALLMRPSSHYTVVDKFERDERDPRIVLPSHAVYRPDLHHVFLWVAAPLSASGVGTSGGVWHQQSVRRQLAAFERLCRWMNTSVSTQNNNSNTPLAVCVAIDGSRFPSEAQQWLSLMATVSFRNPEAAALHGRTFQRVMEASTTTSVGLTLTSFLTYAHHDLVALLDLTTPSPSATFPVPPQTVQQLALGTALTYTALADPVAASSAMHRAANLTVGGQYSSHVRELFESNFESVIHDKEFSTMLLFGGGAGCPHTPHLLKTLSRVADVFQRDRKEVLIAHIDATREMSAEMRHAYGVDAHLPQLRWFRHTTGDVATGSGSLSERQDSAAEIGIPYTGTPFRESLLEFIHFEMGYSYVEYDYTEGNNTLKTLAPKEFEAEMEASQHTVLFLFDTLAKDKADISMLHNLSTHYFNANGSTVMGAVSFYKMDGRRFPRLLQRHNIDLADRPLPQLLFLPRGSQKLTDYRFYGENVFLPAAAARKSMNKSKVEPLTAVNAATFILRCMWKNDTNSADIFAFDDATLMSNAIRSQAELDHVKMLTTVDFRPFLRETGDRVVLFYTPQCPRCQEYLPLYGKAAASYRDGASDDIQFGAVDLSQQSELGHSQGIQTIPTVIVYFEGSTDKTTVSRGEIFTGSKSSPEPLITYLNSIRGTNKVRELDGKRRAIDASVTEILNISAYKRVVGSAKLSSSLEFDFSAAESSHSDPVETATRKTATKVVEDYDDKEYLPPTLVEFYAPWCGHCHHMKRVLLDVERVFKHRPLPAPTNYVEALIKSTSPETFARSSSISIYKIDGLQPHGKEAAAFSGGVSQYPTIFLYFTRVLTNGTMRHCHVRYTDNRFSENVVKFVRTHLVGAVPEGLQYVPGTPHSTHDDSTSTPPASKRKHELPGQVADSGIDDSSNKGDDNSVAHRPPVDPVVIGEGFEGDEDQSPEETTFNTSITLLTPKMIRQALRRPAVAFVMTYQLPRDSIYAAMYNELFNGVVRSPVYKQGFLQVGVIPQHSITEGLQNVTGWDPRHPGPQVTLLRGLATPQIVHFNATTAAGTEESGFDAGEITPVALLQFLDRYGKTLFQLPPSLNTTTFTQAVRRLYSTSPVSDQVPIPMSDAAAAAAAEGKTAPPYVPLRRFAVMLTEQSCNLCNRILGTTSFSTQTQMALHDPSVFIGVLDVKRSPRLYRQWGSPKLPAILLFQRPKEEKEPFEKVTALSFPMPQKLDERVPDDDDSLVPKRKDLHKWIMEDHWHHNSTVLTPALGFVASAAGVKGRSSASSVAGSPSSDEGLVSVGGRAAATTDSNTNEANAPLLTAETSYELADTLNSGSGLALVIVQGSKGLCPACAKTVAAVQGVVALAHQSGLTPLTLLQGISLTLPPKSSPVERALRKMGFQHLSYPTVYVVRHRSTPAEEDSHTELPYTVERYTGEKGDAARMFDFLLDCVPRE